MKKILFIQHASNFGGSTVSLLYTLLGLANQSDKYKVVIALAKWNEKIAHYYESHNIDVVKHNWIDTYEHTTALTYNLLNPWNWYKEIRQRKNIKKAIKTTNELLLTIKPDIVHLNSVVLLGSALACKENKIPFVWHVREHPVNGLLGYRTNKLKKVLRQLPEKCLFICKTDKQAWGNPDNGEVVFNFVDFAKFNINNQFSKEIGDAVIPDSDFNILFLGGISKIKGGISLIRAFAKLVENNPKKTIRLLFAGGSYTQPDYFLINIARKILPLFGLGTHTQKIERAIKVLNLENSIVRLPFVKEVPKLLAHSHVLVFPAIRPHFARPIIEAGAMGIPVIGSDLASIRELIEEKKNGLTHRVDNVHDLYVKLNYLLNNAKSAKEMGEYGNKIAMERYNQEINIKQIITTYDTILKSEINH